MRRVGRCVLTVCGIAASVVVGPAGVGQAAAIQPYMSTIESMRPSSGEVVGIGHPVVVTFTGPVADRRLVERSIDVEAPGTTGTFEWLANDVLQWMPDQYWPAHSTVALSVGNKPLNFATGPAVVGVADVSEHTFTVTVDGADAGPPIPLPSPHHRKFWGQDGVLPASMGRPEYPTPLGKYTVLGKERDVLMDSSSVGIPVSSPDGYMLDVEYAVRITSRGLFVHSAPWAENALGYENVSHGCVSLSPTDAEWYYNTVNVGDPVIVVDTQHRVLPSS